MGGRPNEKLLGITAGSGNKPILFWPELVLSPTHCITKVSASKKVERSRYHFYFLCIRFLFHSVLLRLQSKLLRVFFGYHRSRFACNRRNINPDTTEIHRKTDQTISKRAGIDDNISTRNEAN